MEIQLDRRLGFLLLRIDGDLRLWNRPQVEERLLTASQSALDQAGGELVLSLRGLTTIDSLGIGALVRIVTGCARRNIALKVVMPKGIPREVLERIKIFSAWPELADEPSSLAQKQ